MSLEMDNCPVCLDVLDPAGAEELSCVPCNHQFHRPCLKQWFLSGTPGDCCPKCRRFITKKERVTFLYPEYTEEKCAVEKEKYENSKRQYEEAKSHHQRATKRFKAAKQRFSNRKAVLQRLESQKDGTFRKSARLAEKNAKENGSEKQSKLSEKFVQNKENRLKEQLQTRKKEMVHEEKLFKVECRIKKYEDSIFEAQNHRFEYTSKRFDLFMKICNAISAVAN